MPHRAAALAALALLATLAAPARAADVAQGETLAKRWCASCHLVSADQTRATPDAPSFAAIARRPDAGGVPVGFAYAHARYGAEPQRDRRSRRFHPREIALTADGSPKRGGFLRGRRQARPEVARGSRRR